MDILMRCPNDNTELAMTVRQGVELDYCPQCRGIWLDRGELDKLITRSEALMNEQRNDLRNDLMHDKQIGSAREQDESSEERGSPQRNPQHKPLMSHNSYPDSEDRSYIETSAPKERKRDDFLSEIFNF